METFLSRISSIGSHPGDDDETRLQKSLLVLYSASIMIAGIAWGCMYIIFDEKLAGSIPLIYSASSLLILISFGFTRQFGIFRFSQLLLLLLLPFALMISLGGFVNGSAVILWGLMSPLGAMLFDKPGKAPRWFFSYILLVIVSGASYPWINFSNNLSIAQRQIFFVINVIGPGSVIFLMVFYFQEKRIFFQKRSEILLLNILPAETAQELKATGAAEAKSFDEVTVMFTDFKGFTTMSEKLSPQELVNEINYCYSAFDNIITKYGIEKIKTIGDSYMCAGGLPVANKTNAEDTIKAAIEIRDFMEHEKQKRQAEAKPFFEIRIGCNTGHVVAGIVGLKKFAYDIWGDTVNIASRMESSGKPGKVNISCSTYQLVKDKFKCEHRGKIEAKNKGMIDMYFVES
ncbi:MAG: adenylate/guanylate cyclase domain-containing protein [Bacteroidia bacterium]